MSGLVFDINVALPELMMAIAGLGLLLLGVFLGEKSFRAVTWTAFSALGLVFLTTVLSNLGEGLVAFGGLFRIDASQTGVKTSKIASLDKPTALTFAPDGTLYITVIGPKGENENASKQGKLLKVAPGL